MSAHSTEIVKLISSISPYFSKGEAPNARICMLTDVGSSRKLEPTKDAGEAVPEL
jgi:hypothetical protein